MSWRDEVRAASEIAVGIFREHIPEGNLYDVTADIDGNQLHITYARYMEFPHPGCLSGVREADQAYTMDMSDPDAIEKFRLEFLRRRKPKSG